MFFRKKLNVINDALSDYQMRTEKFVEGLRKEIEEFSDPVDKDVTGDLLDREEEILKEILFLRGWIKKILRLFPDKNGIPF